MIKIYASDIPVRLDAMAQSAILSLKEKENKVNLSLEALVENALTSSSSLAANAAQNLANLYKEKEKWFNSRKILLMKWESELMKIYLTQNAI